MPSEPGVLVAEQARKISSRGVQFPADLQAGPTHAPAHEAAHCASIGGHAVIGDMDLHCVGLIALRIESVARPTRRASRGDVESKPIADLFTGDTAPDPGVKSANLPPAAFDMDMSFAIAARPIPEKRGVACECRAPGLSRGMLKREERRCSP